MNLLIHVWQYLVDPNHESFSWLEHLYLTNGKVRWGEPRSRKRRNWMWLLLLWMALVALAYGLVFAIDVPIKRRDAVASGAIVLQEKTNTLAIVALVASFFTVVGGIVMGHIAISQINRTNERGWGMAFAALVIGYVYVAAVLALIITIIYLLVTAPH